MASPRLSSARNWLENPWFQRALLCAMLLAVFWHGLFAGVPRADQVAYLHQAGQYGGLWDMLRHAPAWNRLQGAGDLVLYRPVLYALLGTLFHFFLYDFSLWQIASLVLHITTVLGVHALLIRGTLRQTPLPFLLALFFGTALLGSEMVLWNHMAGYLLFCALAVFSLVLLLRHLETGRLPALAGCLALAVLAEFTYELGVVLCGLMALGFAIRHGLRADNSTSAKRPDLFAAFLFLLAALAYPAISLADLHLRGIARPLSGEGQNVLSTLPLALDYAVQQARFWLGGWLFPSAYLIQANSRALFLGLQANGALFVINASASLCFLAVLVLRLRAMRAFLIQGRQGRLMVLLGVLLFVCAYSLVIAQGRAVPRGLDYVLRINIYYSYIFCFALVAGVGFVLGLPSNGGAAATVNAPQRRAMVALSLCLAVMTGCNALSTAALARSYRFDYAAPRQALADAVETWLAGPGRAPDAYFSISPECTGNDPQPWMNASHLRKGSGWQPPVTFADALWPEKSYALNKARLSSQQVQLTELPYGHTRTLPPSEPASAP